MIPLYLRKVARVPAPHIPDDTDYDDDFKDEG